MPKRKEQADMVGLVSTALPVKKTKTAGNKSTNLYTAQQKSAIQEFAGVTHSDKSSAAKLLKQHGWSVTAAVNAYFSNNAAANPARPHLTKIFDSYRDDPTNEPDEINIEGTMKMLEQLQIAPDDVSALIFSEIVSSPTLGTLTRDGFVDGWADLSIDSLQGMQKFVLKRRSELASNNDVFKSVYTHTFQLALPSGAKTLPIETAIEFWRMLFSSPGFEWRTKNAPWLDWWLEFQEATRTKAVNKDLWKQTLVFARETIRDETLSFWSDESSWPSVVDEFVEWVKTEKLGGEDAMAVDGQ